LPEEGASIDPEAMADYILCFGGPQAIAGSCAENRSPASIDIVHEPLCVWRQYANDIRGESLSTGHFLPEALALFTVAVFRCSLTAHVQPGRGQHPGSAVTWNGLAPRITCDCGHVPRDGV
jgi:hypothetical protein